MSKNGNLSKKEKTKIKNKLEKLKENKKNEDSKWIETDKNILNKQARKEEKDMKKIQNDERKKQLKLLAEKEMEDIENNQKKSKKMTVPRMTAAQINQYQKSAGVSGAVGRTTLNTDNLNSIDDQIDKINTPKNIVKKDYMEIENINHYINDSVEANTIEGAINALSNLIGESTTISTNLIDGKPIKSTALFNAFKEREIPRLKKEYPTFKYSQINQMVVKLWIKSPDNPANNI